MSAGLESAGRIPDPVKWSAAAALLAAGLAAFYYFADYSLLGRVVALLVVAGAVLVIAGSTARGRVAWEFIRESRTEVRKVVWPSRKETVQTTSVVIAMVTLVAIIMWLLDGVLSWLIRAVLG